MDVNKIHILLASVPEKKLKKSVFQRLDFYRGCEFDFPSNEELYRKLGKSSRFDGPDTEFIKGLLQTELIERLRNKIIDDLFDEYISLSENALVKEWYMSEDQVKLMHRLGMEFGIHGYDHYWLGKMPEREAIEDIKKALTVFSGLGVVNSHEWTMCYPYGSFNDAVIRFIREKGCCLGFSTEVKVANLHNDNILALPRLDTNDFPPKSDNYKTLI